MKRKLLLASCLVLLNSANAFASAAGKDGKKPEGAKPASASSAASEATASQSAATPSQHDGEIDTASYATTPRLLLNNYMATSGNAQSGSVAAAAATSQLLVRRTAAPRHIAIAQRKVPVMMGMQLGNITVMKLEMQTINQKLYSAGEATPTHYRSATLQDAAGRLYKGFIPTLDTDAPYAQTVATPTGYESQPCTGHKHFLPTL